MKKIELETIIPYGSKIIEVSNNKIYCIGGYDNPNFLDSNFEFDINTSKKLL